MSNWIKALAASVVAVFAPIYSVMATVGFLIAADLITGIIAARKRGEKISSAALRRTISKVCVYQLAIMSGFLVETYIGIGIPVSKMVAATIGMVELLSVLENLQQVHGSPIFSKIISKLGSDNDKKDK